MTDGWAPPSDPGGDAAGTRERPESPGGASGDPNVPRGWSTQQPPPAKTPYGWWGPGQVGPHQGDWHPGGWGHPAPPAAKPGVVPLRPLGVGEILDGAISCIRTYPRITLGLSAIVMTAATVLQLLVSWVVFQDLQTAITELRGTRTPTPGQLAAILSPSLITFSTELVVIGLATLVLTGILTYVVSRAVLGRPVTLGESWDAVRPRLLPLFGLTLLVQLIVTAGVLGPWVPGAVSALTLGASPLTVLLLVLAFPVMVVVGPYLYVTFSLATPALILEKQPVLKAMGRSRRLVRGNWWRVFGILLLSAILVILIQSVLAAPFTLIGQLIATALSGGPASDSTAYFLIATAIASIGNILALTVVSPFAAAVVVLLYVDLRIRREALDLELARAAGVAAPTSGGTHHSTDNSAPGAY
ncbi:hypothetical protein C3Y87_02005 [Carbonactinospora thermoautotrophica]|nr:hypothetical protein [Carbonactinospora thermoautotrophica]